MIVAAVLAGGSACPPAANAADELHELLGRVGERIRTYYDRLLTLTCTEAVVQQELRANLAPGGRPRRFVYDVIVTRAAPDTGSHPGVTVERHLRMLNGRAATPRDQPACTDPQSAYADPLAFLLPENRPAYRFSLRGRQDAATVVEFEQIRPEPTRLEWTGSCFTASGGRSEGRIWIDPATDEVLRLETRLAAPFRLPVDRALVGGSRYFMTLERQDVTMQFTRVAFQAPEETLVLPGSVVTLTILNGASIPRMRTEQTFSNYRRFMTDVRIR